MLPKKKHTVSALSPCPSKRFAIALMLGRRVARIFPLASFNRRLALRGFMPSAEEIACFSAIVDKSERKVVMHGRVELGVDAAHLGHFCLPA